MSSAVDMIKRIKCDRCSRQAKAMVLFIGNGELLMCFQCLGPEGGVIRDRIADEGGTILEIALDPLFPGMHLPVPNSTKRPAASENRCPWCNSGQTYVRAGDVDRVCRACTRVWPVASIPRQQCPSERGQRGDRCSLPAGHIGDHHSTQHKDLTWVNLAVVSNSPPISPALRAKELEAREQQKRDLQVKLRAESHRRALRHPSMTDAEYTHLTQQYVELCREDDEGRAAA